MLIKSTLLNLCFLKGYKFNEKIIYMLKIIVNKVLLTET